MNTRSLGLFFLFLPLLATLGCTTAIAPKTPFASRAGYTYVPIDSFAVNVSKEASCSILDSLPDNTVRMSFEVTNAKGEVSYGVGHTSAKTSTYKVTADFISADTISFPVWIVKLAEKSERQVGKATRTGVYEKVAPFEQLSSEYFWGTEKYVVVAADSLKPGASPMEEPWEKYYIPLYVGVGLRTTAEVWEAKANTKLTGLGTLGAEAEAGRIKGGLIVQTLGVNGEAIQAALPIQSELNRTTATGALIAISAIKTLLHDDNTDIFPRVVGMYVPFAADTALVSAVISALASVQIAWDRKCPMENTVADVDAGPPG